jgi:DNA-binding NarL/FixJ family response regulator
VLVVGSDARFLKVAEFLLARGGCDVMTVRGFDGLLETAERYRPHVAVIDGSDRPGAAARAAERLQSAERPVSVLVLSEDTDAPALQDLVVLPKWERLEQLADQVKQIYIRGAPARVP